MNYLSKSQNTHQKNVNDDFFHDSLIVLGFKLNLDENDNLFCFILLNLGYFIKF